MLAWSGRHLTVLQVEGQLFENDPCENDAQMLNTSDDAHTHPGLVSCCAGGYWTAWVSASSRTALPHRQTAGLASSLRSRIPTAGLLFRPSGTHW